MHILITCTLHLNVCFLNLPTYLNYVYSKNIYSRPRNRSLTLLTKYNCDDINFTFKSIYDLTI